MNWEAYQGTHPFLTGDGFWADVTYSPDQQERIKGFISVWGKKVGAMGHIWFPRHKKHQESHLYQFKTFSDSSIWYEIKRDLSFTDGDVTTIPADMCDKLVYLATSFWETYPEYAYSLDRCMRDVLKKTEKRE